MGVLMGIGINFEPDLIHEVDVVIEPVDKAATVYHSRAREPVKQVARSASVTVGAQVQWVKQDDGSPTRGGAEEGSSGYLVFRRTDLEAKGYDPKRGDKVTSIDTQTGLQLFLMGREPAGHYGGTNKLLLMNFGDRQPRVND